MVWTGPGAERRRARLAEYGAAKVYVAGGAEFDDYVVAPKAEVLAAAGRAGVPGGRAGGQHAPRARRSPRGSRSRPAPGVITDAIGLDEGLVAEQSIFGGADHRPVQGHDRHADRRRAAQRGRRRAVAAAAAELEQVDVSLSATRPRPPGSPSGWCRSAASGPS